MVISINNYLTFCCETRLAFQKFYLEFSCGINHKMWFMFMNKKIKSALWNCMFDKIFLVKEWFLIVFFHMHGKMGMNLSVQNCEWPLTLQIFGGAVWGENWSLCEAYAGSDPGLNQTRECEIQLKGKQLIKLHYKGDIISPLFPKYSFHPSLFSFLCFNLLIWSVFTTSYNTEKMRK